MNTFFPESIAQHIIEYADELATSTRYWKARFSNDVLTSIDKGYRLVGMVLIKQKHDKYDLHGYIINPTLIPCTNCYSRLRCSHDHDRRNCGYAWVSFEEIKRYHSDFDFARHIPYEHWSYFDTKRMKARATNSQGSKTEKVDYPLMKMQLLRQIEQFTPFQACCSIQVQ